MALAVLKETLHKEREVEFRKELPLSSVGKSSGRVLQEEEKNKAARAN